MGRCCTTGVGPRGEWQKDKNPENSIIYTDLKEVNSLLCSAFNLLCYVALFDLKKIWSHTNENKCFKAFSDKRAILPRILKKR